MGVMTLSITTFNITALSIMTFSIIRLSITILMKLFFPGKEWQTKVPAVS
jgi:hypothetical protein